jgi:predicted AAA+ superfamily ATPase
MATKRLKMKQIKDVLRLRFQQGLSYREIADSLGISKSSVLNTLKRFSESGLSGKEWEKWKEEELLLKLYPDLSKLPAIGITLFSCICNKPDWLLDFSLITRISRLFQDVDARVVSIDGEAFHRYFGYDAT